MADPTLLTIIVPAASSLFGAVIGSAITHFLTARRDRHQRRREFKLKYLVEAWQNLETGSRDEIEIKQKSQVLEKALADIQLFGSPEQILMGDRFAKEMVLKNSSNTTPLLGDLQNSLRQELGLAKSPLPLFFFRLTAKQPPPPSEKRR